MRRPVRLRSSRSRRRTRDSRTGSRAIRGQLGRSRTQRRPGRRGPNGCRRGRADRGDSIPAHPDPYLSSPLAAPSAEASTPRNGRMSSVNSSGRMNFVAGPAPSALRASRYCSINVFSSTPLAAPKIVKRACAYPSAFKIAACRAPSARRTADCLSPSAMVTVAVFLPSASMTTARRLRSADIWRIIASVTFLGGRISRISTFVTLTPQRVVTSSSFVRRIALISSRFDSTSSRMMSPMTARRVVVAIPIAAPSKLFTRITESAALATLKYTMKSTSTGALSFVMHVWCGIVRYRSRRSTRTGLSIPGMTTTIPGPFSAWAFPKRKFTIRSYSLTTLRLAKSRIRTIITKTNAPTAAPTRSVPWSAVTEPRSSSPRSPHMPVPPGAGCSLPDLRPWSDFRKPACGGIETFILFRPVRWSMSPEERLQTVLHGSEEVVTRDELRTLLDRTGTPRAYVGLEPSGLMHIGTAFIIGSKVEDLIRAGFHAIIFLADWHAYINDKLGRDLENLRICADYFKDGFRAVGVPDSVEYLYANEFVRHPEYWQTVIQASKASTVARIRRALTIMGRKEEEADLDASKLIYPAMQVADIHWMNLDLALGGMDQRHAHMLYRDVAPKLGWKQVVALHTPLLLALDGGGRMDLVAGKMSKSRPDASILLNDGPRDVERKIAKAFCPAKEPVGNPVLEIARLILFPSRGKLMIPRDPKFGGDVTYASFSEVAKSYADGELHPKDLKAGVAAGLNDALAPVRKFFDAHPQNLEAVKAILRNG